MELITTILLNILILSLSLVTLFIVKKNSNNKSDAIDETHLIDAVKTATADISNSSEKLIKNIGDNTESKIKELSENTTNTLALISKNVDDKQSSLQIQMQQFQLSINTEQKTLRETITKSLEEIRSDNERKLNEIRGTVDEKLQKTLNERISESFKTVREQLDSFQTEVAKLGTIASDVGDLKGVLSNVKTKGILGELQLESILQEIIPGQFETQIPTIKGSTNRVDFAIRIPFENSFVYLPVDSKFPTELYCNLQEALEEGDKEKVQWARKSLSNQLKTEAKSIRDKYIDTKCETTVDFAVMFLPIEGLYAEAVNLGLIEEFGKLRVMLAGPSTMMALLNSIRLMLKAVSLQRNSAEIFSVFEGVRKEFAEFEKVLTEMETNLDRTKESLRKLQTTRTNKINAQFKKVDKLDFVIDDNTPALTEET